MKKRTDQQICVDAVRQARRILSDFTDPGGGYDAIGAVFQILEVMDNQTVDGAMERIDGRSHFEVVTANAPEG